MGDLIRPLPPADESLWNSSGARGHAAPAPESRWTVDLAAPLGDRPVYGICARPNLACFFGDSGGPWFSGSMMYGTHTHGFTWGTEQGECGGATLMSLGFLSEMTLEALTAG